MGDLPEPPELSAVYDQIWALAKAGLAEAKQLPPSPIKITDLKRPYAKEKVRLPGPITEVVAVVFNKMDVMFEPKNEDGRYPAFEGNLVLTPTFHDWTRIQQVGDRRGNGYQLAGLPALDTAVAHLQKRAQHGDLGPTHLGKRFGFPDAYRRVRLERNADEQLSKLVTLFKKPLKVTGYYFNNVFIIVRTKGNICTLQLDIDTGSGAELVIDGRHLVRVYGACTPTGL